MADKLQKRSLDPDLDSYAIEASTTIEQGDIVVSNANGYAAPGSTATGLVCLGIAQERVVNSGAAGAKRVNVLRGVYQVANDGGDALVQADVGRVCYITNASTVSKTATGKSKAGTVREVLAGNKVRVELGVGATAS